MRSIALIAIWSAMLAGCGVATPTATIPPDLPANVAYESQMLDQGEAATVLAGDIAPDFSFRSRDGQDQKLSDLRGRVIIVNFWATWCGPCRQEMPDLQKIADQYGDRVVVLGVNKLEEPVAIGPFARELGVRFTLVANPSGDISERYGVRNLPTTYFIEPDGTVGDWRLGAVSYDEAAAIVEQLL